MGFCVGENPLPFPHISNNQNCQEYGEVPDEMLRLRCDPFIRLVTIPTKSSMLKKRHNECAPHDSLDRALSACYDQHRQWWVPKHGVTMQCETYRLFPFGRAQARLCRLQCLPCCPMTSPCGVQTQQCVNHEPYRNDANHMDCSIGNPHISSSTRGYGRSCGGNFFNY